MSRIRTIKPEFWSHEELSALPEATHMLAAALLNYADDHGYFNANPGLVRAACSPLREPSVSIPESLRSLQAVGYIDLGTAPDGKRYGRIVHFDLHQKVSHAADSKIAKISITWDASGEPPEDFRKPPEPLRPEQGTGNREQGTGKGSEANASGAVAPASEILALPAKAPDAELFRVGREVLGKSAGGVIAKLRKSLKYDDVRTLEVVREAAGKDRPMEWVQGVLRGDTTARTSEREYAEIYRGVL